MAAAVSDVLGAPYTCERIVLPDDDEGTVVASLVHRPADPAPDSSEETARGAVLHVHGFADYFFQTTLSDFWCARGYDFYALDLRKYGRSLLAHQTPNYTADLAEYFPELDEAWHRITARDGHGHVVLSAHSTGGLTVPLWVEERRDQLGELAGLVLNSPWFDLAGPAPLRSAPVNLAVEQLGRRRPDAEIPRNVSGLYARSLHVEHDGEFDFDLAWKPLTSWPVRAGWLRAVRAGQARLHAGLHVPCPVLVLTSEASSHPKEMGELVHSTDVVLDVEQIWQWSPSVARHVTVVALPGARHDVYLSRPPVRGRAFEVIDTWRTAWLPRP